MSLEEYNDRQSWAKARDKARKKQMNKAARDARKKIKNEGRCRNPDCRSGLAPEWHHAVPRSKFGKWDEAKHSTDNALPVCRHCHNLWHNGDSAIPRSSLLPSEIAFILSHAGESFLDLHYPEV